MSVIGEYVRGYLGGAGNVAVIVVVAFYFHAVASSGMVAAVASPPLEVTDPVEVTEIAPDGAMPVGGQSEKEASGGAQTHRQVSLGPSCVTAMAYNAKDDLIYAVDGSCDGLIIINELMRLRIHVGPLGFPAVCGLTFDRDGKMFAVDGESDQLLKVDIETGQATSIGPLGFGSVQSLTCDRLNRLYGIDTATDQLVCINKYTGHATAVSKIDAPSVFSLAFVEGQGLYGVDIASNVLCRINMQTGECERLSASGQRICETHGLTAGRNGRLLAYAVRQDVLCELDIAAGTVMNQIQIREQSVSRFVTQAIPDALPTRILFGMSLLAMLVAMCIQCGRLGTRYACEAWQQTRGVFAGQRAVS